MDEHQCACRGCDPSLAGEQEEVVGRYHVADPGARNLRPFRRVQIDVTTFTDREPRYVEGTELVGECYEIQVGVGGWAKRWRQPKHICRRCGVGACSFIERSDLFFVELP